MKTIIDCKTNQIIRRELTEEELAQQVIDEATANTVQAELAAQAAAKSALLARLGITEEEAKLLLS